MRTLLTMFGIGWGVMSIMLMVAAGEGLRRGQMNAQRTLGKDILIVMPGRTSLQAGGQRAGRRVYLEFDEVESIRRDSPAVALLTPELGRSSVAVRSGYNAGNFRVTGALPFFADIRSLTVRQGRFWNDGDERDRIWKGRRAAFAAMGRVSPHGNYVHLYVNGLYWGMYQPGEKPDASFAAHYFGGEKEEYDALNSGEVIDGNRTAWNTMMSIANAGISSRSHAASTGLDITDS